LIQHRTTARTSPSDPESDEIICNNCGIGVSYNIQESNRPEKRAFSTEELTVKSRTSLPPALARHDIGVASIIEETELDFAGCKIDVEKHSPMNKVKDG
jgi:transcription initiation factor TFIIIB Brf1 subunit/transcription initiation factor TFIIB